jgi:hypothetical protein
VTHGGLAPHVRAVRRVLEALTACSLVAALISAARGQWLWALLLAAVAFGCYEASAEVER